MRKINKIVVHSSATWPDQDIDIDDIRSWHKGRGFVDVGYHFFIKRSGQIQEGRPVSMIGAHTKGHNRDSIGICLEGGLRSGTAIAESNFTWVQLFALKLLTEQLCSEHLPDNGDIDIVGHRDLAYTECPSFNVKEFIKSQGW